MNLVVWASGAACWRLLRCVASLVVLTLPALALAIGPNVPPLEPMPAATRVEAVTTNRRTAPADCDRLTGTVRPLNRFSRRAHIAELQLMRPLCINAPSFLALLGAVLLEEGDAEQALVWLERSLLLEPDNLGARADLAFALAELGQPDALKDMAELLRNRADLPPALRARLYPTEVRSLFAFPVVRLGQPTKSRWGTQAEVNLLVGHEDNLDYSPRLSELTLTFSDGPPLVLPVTSQARSGTAAIGSAAFQLAYAPHASALLRTGGALMARTAASHHATDWHQWQWGAGAVYRLNGLRTQLDVSFAGFGGPLGEPYGLRRVSLSAEALAQECAVRLSAEAEHRNQSKTTSLDATTSGWLASLECPLVSGTGWQWSVDARGGRDRPDSSERPGGMQQQRSVGLRLAGNLWHDTRVMLSVRKSVSQDQLGFSPLLENNAARRLQLRRISVEVSKPLYRWSNQRLDGVFQWQEAAQGSNLALFNYRARSAYGGLRYLW